MKEDEKTEIKTCKCGKPIKYACSQVCEDCWVNNQVRWHEYDQSAKIK